MKKDTNIKEAPQNTATPPQAIGVPDSIGAVERAIIPPEEQTGGKRSFVSAGEHIHKWSTYLSIDWIYNATAGAIFAYWGKFTPSGKALWSKPVDKAFETMLAPMIKNPATLKTSVAYGNTFMSIIAGGMLTIPPLLLLEDKDVKLSITKAIDEAVYGKDRVKNDPKFQQAYDEIEHAPKKDFVTGMTSRFAALAPLLAAILIPTSGSWLKKNLFRPVGSATKVALAKIGLPESKLFGKFSPAEQQARWNYVHDDAIAMDLSFGLPYAVLHAYFYNTFANNKEEVQEHTQAQRENASEPLPAQKPESQYASLVKQAKHPEQNFTDYVSSLTQPSFAMGAA